MDEGGHRAVRHPVPGHVLERPIENLQIELLNLQLLKAYCFAASRMRSAILAIVVAAS